ncbi:HAD family hydrolase [Paenibacillus sambharensis]|uniref:HAD family hydrolase n=1 Tax=Paenibacillus sambharensis TaxID=1803190 RepID=A0A2W1LGT8_9BACL|nr:HAD-IB family phosphatase [Paenibacillus sambharensis]PZD94262.1 HAD family hydrolase [Paenibacillus sambharensis]
MADRQLSFPEAVIFDMDGTLFQTETLLTVVHDRLFQQLREEGLYTKETPPVEALLSCLGMLLKDIWFRVIPDGTPEVHQRADELMLELELEEIAASRGNLYPYVPETLKALKDKGIKLFVASNGLQDYVEAIALHRTIDKLFDGLYTAGGRSTATKVELVRILLEEHGIKSAWMVGDRSSDVEAGKGNGLEVIGCGYAAFGKPDELEGSDVIITDFRELLDLLPKQG